jgi:hypothetical protein
VISDEDMKKVGSYEILGRLWAQQNGTFVLTRKVEGLSA